jgi:hypothetical protein
VWVQETVVKQDEDLADLARCSRDASSCIHSQACVIQARKKTVNELCRGQPFPTPWLFLIRKATVVKSDHGEQNLRYGYEPDHGERKLDCPRKQEFRHDLVLLDE